MDKKIIISVAALLVLIGLVYVVFVNPTGLVTLPIDGGNSDVVTGDNGSDAGNNGQTVKYEVSNMASATAKAVADSELQALWDTKNIWCGEVYHSTAGAVSQIVELDFKAGTARCLNSTENERWYNTLNSYQPLGVPDAFVSSLSQCENSVASEYEALLKGNTGAFGSKLALSEKCDNCDKAYAVHLFCQPVKGFGTVHNAENAIAFVDAATGEIYS